MSAAGLWSAFSEMRNRGPDLPLPVLLARMLMWRIHRATRAAPIVRLHARSRMRLRAKPGERGIQAAIFLYRDAYEPSVRAAIDRFVRDGDLVYDIGANLGLWSLRMAERAGKTGCVYAFEPVPDTATQLAANARLSGHTNIVIGEHALGEHAGELTLYVPDDIGRSSFAAESEQDLPVKVKVHRLDDLWQAQGRPTIGFIKIDVEGAEPLVFRGASEFLKFSRPFVCCEVNPDKLANMGFTPSDVIQPLLQLGYQVRKWSKEDSDLIPVTPENRIEESCDLVFAPR